MVSAVMSSLKMTANERKSVMLFAPVSSFNTAHKNIILTSVSRYGKISVKAGDMMIYTVNDIKRILSPVFYCHNVRKAVLFGSYVNGKATENSDVDLLVDSGLRGLRFVGMAEDIRDALRKEVDVFDTTHIIPDSKIYSEISKNGVTIYEA